LQRLFAAVCLPKQAVCQYSTWTDSFGAGGYFEGLLTHDQVIVPVSVLQVGVMVTGTG